MREARKRAREAETAGAAAQKAALAEAARLEVEASEAHLDELTSVHRECVEPVNWRALAAQPAPSKPSGPAPVDPRRSEAAKKALRSYRPGFFERMLGLTSRKVQLELRVAKALAAEAAEEAEARERHLLEVRAWEEAMEDWRDARELAEQVLKGDVDAYGEAIRSTECLAELAATLGTDELRVDITSERAELTLTADESTLVPLEQKTLSARGAVSSKKLPAARRTEIYQDYVCGAALRAAREVMAVTPLEAVLVHVEAPMLDTSSGNMKLRTILSVLCTRRELDPVNWDLVDASDLVETLEHRMKLTRGKGFVPVEPLGSVAQQAPASRRRRAAGS
ncbi:MAG: hypothetical protein KIT58_04790 [Planctomycetota bacterium]|nr:hypothetical protein [Planctomycetota bacterium]